MVLMFTMSVIIVCRFLWKETLVENVKKKICSIVLIGKKKNERKKEKDQEIWLFLFQLVLVNRLEKLNIQFVTFVLQMWLLLK